MLSFEYILQTIESAVSRLRFDDSPQSLFDPIVYTLSKGGKRLRPAFVLMACNLYRDEVQIAMNSALGIEMFHNFTLLHDDLMDEAKKRRNRPTVHVKWDRNTAVLSGDAMLIAAYRMIGQTPTAFLKPVLDLFTQTALEICEGQQYDMEFEGRTDVTEEEYMEMIRLKTAVLLACSLKTGALIGNASEQDVEVLYRFGTHIGLAFQLQDDLLDVYGDTQAFGKDIGGDIMCDKKTYLSIQMHRLANDKQKRQIERYRKAYTSNYTQSEKIAAITALYDELEIKELAQSKMKQHYKLALEELEKLSVAQERVQELLRVCSLLMNRVK
ncbi:isoprenyl synthetase [Tannerella sp. oral taxon 808]|nr:isoprenyl synthetase [Tannerella sp. oral taxon 808]